MSSEQLFAGASVVVSLIALGMSAFLITRQTRQLEHERNALAILDAIGRLTDPTIGNAFTHLSGIDQRYPDEASILRDYPGSRDEHALLLVAQYVETVACLARRRVLDVTLLVDAVGYMLRTRWNTIRPFVERLRRVRGNQYLFENFEWLAMYSTWWKDTPRPPRDTNYDEKQFGDLEFKV